MKSILFLFLLLFHSLAFSLPQDVCKAILAYGIHDTSESFSDKQHYQLVKTAICKSEIDTYDKAIKASKNGGVDIIDVLSLSGSGAIDSRNFAEKKRGFCESNYSEASGSLGSVTRIRKASSVIANAFSDCIKSMQGFFGYVTQHEDKEAFSVQLFNKTGGDQTFYLEELSGSPVDIACNNDEHLASKDKPIKIVGSKSISCKNLDPNKGFLLSVNTNLGALEGPDGEGALQLSGRAETISDLIEKVQRLENRSVPSGTIAFFKTKKCNVGWTRVGEDWFGRYFVASPPLEELPFTVGLALNVKNKESRPVGRHDHQYTTHLVAHKPQSGSGHAAVIKWQAGANSKVNVKSEKNTLNKGPEGTNAPYVALTACIKD